MCRMKDMKFMTRSRRTCLLAKCIILACSPLQQAARTKSVVGNVADGSANDITQKGKCPKGLRLSVAYDLPKVVDNKTSQGRKKAKVVTCVYPFVHQAERRALTEGADTPLIFDVDGAFLLKDQIIEETQSAMEDKKQLSNILDHMLSRELEKNKTLLKGTREMANAAFEVAENNKPVEAIFVAAKLATAGHVWTLLTVKSTTGLAASMHLPTGIFAHTMLAKVSAVTVGHIALAALPIVVGYEMYSSVQHAKQMHRKAKAFTSRLLLKASCLYQRLDLPLPPQRFGILKPEVVDSCGELFGTALLNQLAFTNLAVRGMLKSFVEISRCIFPHRANTDAEQADRTWSKDDCANAIYDPLRQINGKPGILYEALVAAATYAQNVDTLMMEPVYNDSVNDVFGISAPQGDAQWIDLISKLIDQSVEIRAAGCMSLIAQTHAFGRVFVRFSQAIKIWIQTFGRSQWLMDVARTGTHMWPCSRVVHSIVDSSGSFCKDEGADLSHGFKIGHKIAETHIDRENVCSAQGSITEEEKGPECPRCGQTLWTEDEGRKEKPGFIGRLKAKLGRKVGPTTSAAPQSNSNSASGDDSQDTDARRASTKDGSKTHRGGRGGKRRQTTSEYRRRRRRDHHRKHHHHNKSHSIQA